MKVGIINCQHIDNYGAVLMTYSMQKILTKIGTKPRSIDFRPLQGGVNKISFLRKIIKIVKQIVKKILRINPSDKNNRSYKFNQFRKKTLKRSRVYNQKTIYKAVKYDAYIVGSDVVWRPGRIDSEESVAYFLKFVPEDKLKINYAPSIGTDNTELLVKLEKLFINNLHFFEFLSCREEKTAKWLYNLTNKEVFHAIDPTLLLKEEDYDELIKDDNSDFIYFYLLGNNDRAYEFVNYVCNKTNLKVKAFCANKERVNNLIDGSQNDGPIEFLSNIKNAKYIITNSYHGVMFSILFKKRYTCFDREVYGMRLIDFLSTLNITDTFVGDEMDLSMNLFKDINYCELSKKIERWREDSINYLKQCLHI